MQPLVYHVDPNVITDTAFTCAVLTDILVLGGGVAVPVDQFSFECWQNGELNDNCLHGFGGQGFWGVSFRLCFLGCGGAFRALLAELADIYYTELFENTIINP